jgi:hypothetical protein
LYGASFARLAIRREGERLFLYGESMKNNRPHRPHIGVFRIPMRISPRAYRPHVSSPGDGYTVPIEGLPSPQLRAGYSSFFGGLR